MKYIQRIEKPMWWIEERRLTIAMSLRNLCDLDSYHISSEANFGDRYLRLSVSE